MKIKKTSEKTDILYNFFDSTPHACIITDSNLNKLNSNRAFNQSFGQITNLKEIFQEAFFNNFTDLVNKNITDIYTTVLDKKSNEQTVIFQVSKKDKHYFFALMFYSKIISEQHSKTKELLFQTEARFRAVFENASVAFALIDDKGKLRDLNKKSCELLGRQKSQINNTSLFEWLTEESRKKIPELISRLQKNKHITNEELSFLHAEKGEVFLSLTITKLPDGVYFCVGTDITEMKRISNLHRYSEERYRHLFELAPDGIMIEDLECNILEANEQFCSILGYSQEELLKMNVRDFVHPNLHKLIRTGVKNVITKGYNYAVVQNRHKDGHYIDLSISESLITLPNGNKAIQVHIRDISEQIRHETLLKLSEERFRTLFDQSHDAIFLLEGNLFVDCNETTLKIFKCTKEQIINQPPYLVSPEYQPDGRLSKEKAMEKIQKAFEGKPQFFYWMHQDFNGKTFDCEVSLKLIETRDKKLIQAIVHDISVRVASEMALRQSEEKYRRLVEVLHEGFYIIQDEKLVFINQNCAEILGRDEDEILGHEFFEFVAPAFSKLAQNEYRQLVNSNESKQSFIVNIVRPDQSERTVNVQLSFSTLNNEPATFGVIQDVTEYKLLNRQLKFQKKFLENIIHSSPVAIQIIEAQSGAVFIQNDAYSLLFGIEKNEADSSFNFWQDEKTEITLKNFASEILNTTKSHLTSDFRIQVNNGKDTIFLRYIGFPIFSSRKSVSHIVLMIENLTRQKLLEDQLIQAQKMETVGTLASGIAHDFNNLLGGIIGYASLLRETLEDDSIHHKYVEKIEKTGERAADLTRKLLTFSRKQEINLGPVNINHCIENVLELLSKNLNKNVRISTNFGANLPETAGDAGQIEQVIMNLCMNSLDALPATGEIQISTYQINKKDVSIIIPENEKNSDFIVLEISDNGHGISDEHLNKIYQPFFTTKEIGKGTGLGLALVYNIIKSHRGYIELKSKKNQGTTFWVYLPVIKPNEPHKEKKDTKTSVRTRHKKTVLLIDDEILIREMFRDTLAQLGLKVIEAENGTEGFKIYQKNHQNIDLVLIDMIMPGPNGLETFRSLKKINKKVKGVLVTGYADEKAIDEIQSEGIIEVLYKPFNYSKLKEMISEIFG